MTTKITKSEAMPIATRIHNAEERFIDYAIALTDGGVTRDEAHTALGVLIKHKAVKIDVAGGQWTWTHGVFAHPLTITNALAMATS